MSLRVESFPEGEEGESGREREGGNLIIPRDEAFLEGEYALVPRHLQCTVEHPGVGLGRALFCELSLEL